MPKRRNYLLGKGRLLTQYTPLHHGHGDKDPVYTVEASRERLAPKFEAVSQELDALPDVACPNSRAVVGIKLHPEYLAKSYFPNLAWLCP